MSIQRVTLANEAYSWDANDSKECRIGFTWAPVGRILLSSKRLEFPKVEAEPGLYRFRIRNGDNEAAYVGESENLARRFAFYRNPGPSQQTNVRLNQIFRSALASAAEIAVAVVTTDAWIETGDGRKRADFSKKAIRRLFENASVLLSGDDSIESLNR
jgi:hypothetical protein